MSSYAIFFSFLCTGITENVELSTAGDWLSQTFAPKTLQKATAWTPKKAASYKSWEVCIMEFISNQMHHIFLIKLQTLRLRNWVLNQEGKFIASCLLHIFPVFWCILKELCRIKFLCPGNITDPFYGKQENTSGKWPFRIEFGDKIEGSKRNISWACYLEVSQKSRVANLML